MPVDSGSKKPAPYVWTQGGKVIHFEFEDGTGFAMFEDQALLMARTIHDVVDQQFIDEVSDGA